MKYLIGLFCLLFLYDCQPTSEESVDAQAIAHDFLTSKKLDKRTTVLKVQQDNGVLSGVVQNKQLRDEFRSYYQSQLSNDDLAFQLELVDSTKIAYVNNSVANARSNPKHSAELSTQYLLGQKVTVIDKEGGWYLVQGPDKYIAWIDAGGLAMGEDLSEEYIRSEKRIVQSNEAVAYSGTDSDKIALDLVFGNLLAKTSGNSYLLPDGREVVIKDQSVFTAPTDTNRVELALTKANSLMGRPYLWGGTSTKGMDCSGFTRTAFMNAGYLLGRDASLQVLEGTEVNKDDISSWQAGDLLFFGNYRDDGSMRVTHVAIHEENGQFIHCAQRVQEESLNPDHHNYNNNRAETLLAVRRIF